MNIQNKMNDSIFASCSAHLIFASVNQWKKILPFCANAFLCAEMRNSINSLNLCLFFTQCFSFLQPHCVGGVPFLFLLLSYSLPVAVCFCTMSPSLRQLRARIDFGRFILCCTHTHTQCTGSSAWNHACSLSSCVSHLNSKSTSVAMQNIEMNGSGLQHSHFSSWIRCVFPQRWLFRVESN